MSTHDARPARGLHSITITGLDFGTVTALEEIARFHGIGPRGPGSHQLVAALVSELAKVRKEDVWQALAALRPFQSNEHDS